jgi:preprotein translocase subunit SecG
MSSWAWEITKRWAEKVLHNTTIILWTIFILNSLVLFLVK